MRATEEHSPCPTRPSVSAAPYSPWWTVTVLALTVALLPQHARAEAERAADLETNPSSLRAPALSLEAGPDLEPMVRHYAYSEHGRRSFQTWLQRAAVFQREVRHALATAGVPEDLWLVAMVESGYVPDARSPANAVGLWQFMSPVALEHGLRIDRWVDERMDPTQSTRAAAKYLQALHERFGTWELALAAYNMGPSALMHSIQKYNTNDFEKLATLEAGLPHETVQYVARIGACIVVAANADQLGFTFDSAAPSPYTEVSVQPGTSLARLSNVLRVDMEELSALNPSLKRNRVPPGGQRLVVRIPEAATEAVSNPHWMEHAAPHLGEHRLRFGETLSDVAKHYGVSTRRLAELNDFHQNEEVPHGTFLLVPPSTQPQVEQSAWVVAVPTQVTAPSQRSRLFFRVRKGMDLKSIAEFFQVTERELEVWNEIDRDAHLHEGMFLQVFAPITAPVEHAIVKRQDEVQLFDRGSVDFLEYYEASRGRVRHTHLCEEGDSMEALSNQYGLSVGSIARINGISRRSDLEEGQPVVVYVEKENAPLAAKLQEVAEQDAPLAEGAVEPEESLELDDPVEATPEAI